MVARNGATVATVPRARRSEVKPPTVETLRALLQAAVEWEPEFALYLRVLAATGCRRSEALALRWTDVGSDNCELHRARSLAIVDGRVIEKDTKRHQSRRIALDPATMAALEMHRAPLAADGLGYAPDSLVFSPDECRERPCRPDNMTSRFIKLCKRNGVTGVRLHDLRHFVATNLGAGGHPDRHHQRSASTPRHGHDPQRLQPQPSSRRPGRGRDDRRRAWWT